MMTYTSPLGDIHIGDLGDKLSNLISDLNPSATFVITDEHTAVHCLPLLQTFIKTQGVITIPAGEPYKNLESCQEIWSFLTRNGADRSALILNLGGGMICDLGGFVASCYQRGIRFCHIPTSVLAMADASIGGKTGVNFEGYKNYIGRIETPSLVWIDPSFINTLPFDEVKNGLAEIVKHSIIGSRALWTTLSTLPDAKEVPWLQIFMESIPIKLKIVEADPFETGLRKILNFGHTLGHAFESQSMEATAPLPHGQAITLGMLAESKIASDMGMLAEEDFQSITELILRLLSPVEVTLPTIESLHYWMQGDKKKVHNRINFSLPDKIGSCGWNIPVEPQWVKASLNWLSTQVTAPSGRLSVEK